MKRSDKNLKGFSLLETVTVVALVSIVATIVVAFLVYSLKSYRIKRESVDEQDKAAHVMNDFEREARAATKILAANQNEFKFYRFFDLTSSEPTQVRYFMNGSNFEIGLTAPVGTSPNVAYPPQNEVVDLVVPNVQNITTLFTYYDENESQLTDPIDITKVKMIGLTVSLDENPNMPPSEVSETTKINLRNMKTNL